ncbi:NAD(P)-binding protein [Microbacterium sp. P04]|uniref:FAD binding domain-containing protein n=1 Tax=Microbacterium sp. P04 TaxID=3366947 RepID=UPI003745BC16
MHPASDTYRGSTAIVVGGSIGGLTAALLLRDIGFDVDVYERTPVPLHGRGGGIVLQPDTMRWFDERSDQDPASLFTSTSRVQYVDRQDGVVYEEEREWRYTSWGTFYRALLADFGEEHYHLGSQAVRFSPGSTGEKARVAFANGTTREADLVVFADGVGSIARPVFDPDALSRYSGYVGWRGTVPVSALSAETRAAMSDAITYDVMDRSHITLYPIPGEEGVDADHQLMNYVWYRNVPAGGALTDLLTGQNGYVGTLTVPPGLVREEHVAELREVADRDLAAGPREVVLKTEQPYLQVVHDSRSARMALGRSALIGDAACAARPHAAAGTAKAAADAWALRDALLATPGDIVEALHRWEPAQLALSEALLERVVEMGERSQQHGTWIPGDPELRFGLYGSGITTHPSPPDYSSALAATL